MARNAAKTSWKKRIFWRRRESFLKEIKRPRFLLTLAVLLLLSWKLGHIWIFDYAGLVGLDAFAQVQPPQAASFSRIVSIREEDYEKYFHSQSPLDPRALSNVIGEILKLHPAVLAVDIDTSYKHFQEMALPQSNIPIVWARDASVKDAQLSPKAILGQKATTPPYSGFALFPYSSDWTVREYPRSFEIEGQRWPSFHWEIAKAFCQSMTSNKCQTVNKTRDYPGGLVVPVFRSRYMIPVFNLADVLNARSTPSHDNPLKDKIVFLGGEYSSGDEHPTPFGIKYGVELIASAVEEELGGGGQQPLDVVASFILKAALAFLIAWFHHILRPRYAMIATILFLGSMVLAGSYIAFRFSGYRADFLPFLVGIWIEQLYEGSEHAQRHSEEQSRPR